MLRLRVAEYFDSVVNEIDLFTETKIQSIKTQTEENWWNKRRREQIDEVRRIERDCLDHVKTLKVEEKEIESGEWMKRVFVEYCFTVDYADLLYLAKANRFVEPRERRLLKIHLKPKNKKLNASINNHNHQSVGVTVLEFEFCLASHFLTDNPVVDISTGLNQCGRIKRAYISDTSDTEPSLIHFDDFLSIEDCKVNFDIESADQDKKAVDVIKYLMSRFDRIEKISLNYDQIDPSPEMKALAQSVKLNDPVKIVFYKRYSYFQEFGLSGRLEKYNNPRNRFVKVVNWQFISEISFVRVSFEDLEKADLSYLHSLTSLHLNMSSTGKSSSGWKFLDVCRASLNQLIIESDLPTTAYSLSSNTFSGMTNLKSLSLSGSFSVDRDGQARLFGDLNQLESLSIHSTSIPFVLSRKIFSGVVNLKSLNLLDSFSIDPDSQETVFGDLTQLERLYIDSSNCTTPFPLSRKTFCTMTNLKDLILRGTFSIPTNNQEELFADLIQLKRLDISLNEQTLTTKWFIHSSTVEELRLIFEKSPKVASSQIRFKLPQLDSLELSFGSDRIECDLTDMMSCFSPKKLDITSLCFEIMTKSWFHRLTSVDELVLDLKCEGLINSQLFEGFDHLTKLTIIIWPENTVDRCALHKLVHLETISFVDFRHKNKQVEIEDKSIFDGLNSLKTIEYSNYHPRSRAYVYFKNLDRFLLVVN